ncbi:P1 family peptidase [Microvirga sp. BT689]|nr:P1 family peptidase [Microvirga arvi]
MREPDGTKGRVSATPWQRSWAGTADGFARSSNLVHTMSDGDTIFALSTGKASSVRADVSAIGAIAATLMAQAVARAVVEAESLTEHQLPAHRDYVKG